jgi:hypothetical protein
MIEIEASVKIELVKFCMRITSEGDLIIIFNAAELA